MLTLYARLIAHAAQHCDVIHAWYGGGPYGSHHTYPLQVARFAGKFLVTNFAWDVPIVDPSVSILVIESESSLRRHYPLLRLHNHGSYDASAAMPAIHYILPGIDAQRFSPDTAAAFIPPGCTCHPPGCYKKSDPSSCFVIGRVNPFVVLIAPPLPHPVPQVSRLVQEKLPAVFVEMAALVHAVRPESRFVLVFQNIAFVLAFFLNLSRTLYGRSGMAPNESF